MTGRGRGASLAVLGLAAALTLGGCATRAAFPAPAEADRPAPVQGYLNDAQAAALAARTPPPPAEGSDDEARDRRASAAFDALRGSDRWRLAQTHAEVRPQYGVAHFNCALGASLDEETAPALVRFLARGLRDAGGVSNLAKATAFRARPVADDPAREACVRVDDALRSSASYPSGHATVGVVWGRMMAEVAPEQAEAVLRVGREIGVSRAVCGLHYPADVAAGQALGEAAFAAMRAAPDYAADLAAARADLARAQASPARDPGCAAQRAALAVPLP